MKIELRVAMTGTRNGEDWPPFGTVVDFPDQEAQDLVDAGLAVVPETPAKGKREAATVEPAENAAAPKPRGRKPSGLTKANGV